MVEIPGKMGRLGLMITVEQMKNFGPRVQSLSIQFQENTQSLRKSQGRPTILTLKEEAMG